MAQISLENQIFYQHGPAASPRTSSPYVAPVESLPPPRRDGAADRCAPGDDGQPHASRPIENFSPKFEPRGFAIVDQGFRTVLNGGRDAMEEPPVICQANLPSTVAVESPPEAVAALRNRDTANSTSPQRCAQPLHLPPRSPERVKDQSEPASQESTSSNANRTSPSQDATAGHAATEGSNLALTAAEDSSLLSQNPSPVAFAQPENATIRESRPISGSVDDDEDRASPHRVMQGGDVAARRDRDGSPDIGSNDADAESVQQPLAQGRKRRKVDPRKIMPPRQDAEDNYGLVEGSGNGGFVRPRKRRRRTFQGPIRATAVAGSGRVQLPRLSDDPVKAFSEKLAELLSDTPLSENLAELLSDAAYVKSANVNGYTVFTL